ncbi:MAG: PAS domain S-box protein [Nitrospira sp.]|jgi:PAS domain S-box-containing protein|nr:PAS domain S-box protein [Nitrospira sp.]MDI3463756.1 diguanylate cyclase/phosphodiesterase (GGDEF & EAL domains) with PAS/PAC sensor(s) [Nitrospira sp.]
MDHVLARGSNPSSIKHTSRLLEILTGYGAWEWDIVSGEVQWFGMHERSAGSGDGRDNDHIQSFTDMLHPDDRVRVWQKLNRSMARRDIPYVDEYRVMHPDGSVRWISGTGRFYYDDTGQPVRMTGVVQDITERKQAEAKLQEDEERLSLALSAANIGSFDWDIPAQVMVWSPETKRIWGLSAGGFGGTYEHWRRQIHPDDVAEVDRIVRFSLENRDIACKYEHRIIRPDGMVRWIHVNATMQRDTAGRSIRMVGVNFDITARKQAEAKLRESEARFRNVFEYAGTGIAIGNLDGNIVQCNPAFCGMLGYTEDELRHVHFSELVHVENRDADLAEIERLRTEELPYFEIENRYMHKNGEPVWVRKFVSLLRDDEGRPKFFVALVTDITERKKADRALRESELRFRTMAETVPSMLFETDAAGLNTWTSEDWCRFTGQTPEQVAGHGWAEALHPDDREVNLSQWRCCLETGRTFESKQRLRRTDGSYTWVIAQALPVRDEEGTVRRWVGSVTNIDAIMRAEEEQARLAAIVENTSDAIIGKDLHGTITSWNRAAETLLGYRAAEVIGRPVTLFFPPDRLEEESAILDRLRKCESIRQYETVRRCKDGRDISVSLTISLVRDKQGRIIGASKIMRDITESKQAEAKLRESEARFRNVFEHAGTGIVIVDLAGNFVQCNPAYCAMLGYIEDELLQVHFSALVHVEDRDANLEETKRLLTGELPYFEIENRYVHKNGEPVWVRKFISLLCDDEGRPMYGLALVTDITERRKAEQALLQAKEHLQRWAVELEKAVNEKTSELVQSQTRLRSLAGELSLAEQRERKRLAGELHDHLQQLLVLGKLTVGQGKRSSGGAGCEIALNRVDDILSEALTYSRTLVTELSPPVLRDHGLAAGLTWLGAYMKKHEQTVTVKVPEGKEVQLTEDQVILLFQSVRELLINSSKYAGTGHATVTMELVDGDLRIIVSDDGAGFDRASLASVAAGPHSSGGISSKFGLFSIEERMLSLGGRFDLYSTPGHGTTATLILPLNSQL